MQKKKKKKAKLPFSFFNPSCYQKIPPTCPVALPTSNTWESPGAHLSVDPRSQRVDNQDQLPHTEVIDTGQGCVTHPHWVWDQQGEFASTCLAETIKWGQPPHTFLLLCRLHHHRLCPLKLEAQRNPFSLKLLLVRYLIRPMKKSTNFAQMLEAEEVKSRHPPTTHMRN